MLTSCHSEGNKEIMNVGGIGTQYPAQRVHESSDDRCPAAATGVNKQADERSCHRTLTRELSESVLFFCLLSKFSHKGKE